MRALSFGLHGLKTESNLYLFQMTAENDRQSHAGPVFYGHTARIWDCHIDRKFLITVSEDCSYQIWTLDGKSLTKIIAHTGRGIWRCVYDSNNCLLITAGADSSIKLHSLYKWVLALGAVENEIAAHSGASPMTEVFSMGLRAEDTCVRKSDNSLDSKSEYVRCLSLAGSTCLYVATNQGFLKSANFTKEGHKIWIEIHHSEDFEPILCMDVLRLEKVVVDNDSSNNFEDWIVLGSGKGSVTVLCICWRGATFQKSCFCSWPAEEDRKLLGVYWSKSLGPSCIFTADPHGGLCMWSLKHSSRKTNEVCQDEPSHVSLSPLSVTGETSWGVQPVRVLCYKSIFNARIVCLDLYPKEELLICGDQRGNIVAFFLPSLLFSQVVNASVEVLPLATFKGAHGISTVASINIVRETKRKQVEVCSTGRDGCICNFVLDKSGGALVCVRVEKVPALTVVERCALYEGLPTGTFKRMIVAGFTAIDFLLFDMQNNSELVRVPCGGWRRPHSYLIGDFPEVQHCFVYVKDRMIHVYRKWLSSSMNMSPASQLLMTNSNLYLSSLLLQSEFHGREIHSVQFISSKLECSREDGIPVVSWMATGAEDGVVRLLRLNRDAPEQFDLSLVLGEHIGGSAVKALALIDGYSICVEHREYGLVQEETTSQNDMAMILLSVGAKEVMTCWCLDWEEELDRKGKPYQILSSRWLSTDKRPQTRRPSKRLQDVAEQMAHDNGLTRPERIPLFNGLEEDDQRYMAVTAFSVRCQYTRLQTCFAVTASSNATVLLHAFQLSYGVWVDIALLDYHKAPVLTLQHLVFPSCKSSGSNSTDMYLIFSGATDGSIAVWDITDVVVQSSHTKLGKEAKIVGRPPIGRGSQGGMRWRYNRNQEDDEVRSISDLKDKATIAVRNSCSGGLEALHSEISTKFNVVKCGESNCMLTSHINEAVDSCGLCPKEARLSSLHKQTEVTPCCQESCISEVYVGDGAFNHLETRVRDGSKDSIEKSQIIASQINLNSGSDNVVTAPKSGNDCHKNCPPQTLNPQFLLPSVHQSGVNSLCVSILRTGQSSFTHQLGSMWMVVSGGDDQALHVAIFTVIERYDGSSDAARSEIVCLSKETILSAHSAAVKGVWTDGNLVFSTGLDQRLRCWQLELSSQYCSLVEHCQSIVNVPEPSALHVSRCNRTNYQVAVVGRGLQIVEVSRGADL